MGMLYGIDLFPWYSGRTFSTSDFNILTPEEKDNEVVIKVDVPGYKRDEIEISLEKGYLSIFAKNETRGVLRKRYVLKYDDISTKDSVANLEDGVLTITFTRSPPDKTIIKIT